MANEWEIKERSRACTVTQRPFEEGEYFYTLLYRERGKGHYRREDLCEEAWKERQTTQHHAPFSFWRTKFERPSPSTGPAEPEPIPRETAETLLRRLIEDPGEEQIAVRYILALMLERKRILKPVETKEEEDGRKVHLYLHGKTGEVFLIPDPELHLNQLEAAQEAVIALLGEPGKKGQTPPA